MKRVKFGDNVSYYRILTSSFRLLPNFIIIGAQRCGTTGFYAKLTSHPNVASATKKEIHFFDLNYHKGLNWYRAHFPFFLGKRRGKMIGRYMGRYMITGEASPYYIFHPQAPLRIAEILPDVRIIILLRNPVERAYSHYQKSVRKGVETLSFEIAIEKEAERLCGEEKKVLEDDTFRNFNHQKFSYLSRGIYIDQISVWMPLFPKEHILILKSEDYYTNPKSVLKRTFNFLNLPPAKLGEQRKANYPNYPKMSTSTRRLLLEYFEEHNSRLYQYLGCDFGWDR